ncbi:hypothetical protein [Kitasatospora sp. NPDC050463]
MPGLSAVSEEGPARPGVAATPLDAVLAETARALRPTRVAARARV